MPKLYKIFEQGGLGWTHRYFVSPSTFWLENLNIPTQLSDKDPRAKGPFSMKSWLLNYLFLFNFAILWCLGCTLLGGGESKIPRAESYDLTPPTKWKQKSAKGESDRAYQLPSGNTVSVTSVCDRTRDASLKVLTRQILIGTRNVRVLEEQDLMIPEGLGLFTSIKAISEGNSFFLGIAVIKKLDCVFDFSLVSPTPLDKEEQKEFLRFVKSIQYGTH